MSYFSKRLRLRGRKILYPIPMAKVTTVRGASYTCLRSATLSPGRGWSLRLPARQLWGVGYPPFVSFPISRLTFSSLRNLNNVNCAWLQMKSRGRNQDKRPLPSLGLRPESRTEGRVLLGEQGTPHPLPPYSGPTAAGITGAGTWCCSLCF